MKGKRFLFFLLLLMSLINANARYHEPDFNYPVDVINAGEELLREADTDDGGSAGMLRLRGTLEIIVAKNHIDPDSMFVMPALVAAQADKATTPDARAMLKCLEAVTYSKIYQDRRYDYDRIEAPALPLPDDVSKWSGEQFRAVIDSLLEQALAYDGDEGLRIYYPCIEIDNFLRPAFPTVRDFISAQAATLYDVLDDQDKERAVMEEALARSEASSAEFFYWKWRLCTGAREIFDAYLEHKSDREARFLLMQCAMMAGRESWQTPDMWQDVVRELRASLDTFPTWPGNRFLENSLERLTVPYVSVECPAYADATKALTLKCDYLCAKRFEVKIYRIPSGNRAHPSNIETYPCVATIPYTVQGDTVQGKAELTAALPSPGLYGVKVTVDGETSGGFSTVNMVPFMSFCLNGYKESGAVCADFSTGTPVKNVAVTRVERRRGDFQYTHIGRTGSNGALLFRNGRRSWDSHLRFTLGGVAYDFNDNIQAYTRTEPFENNTRILVMTERGLYHPGDSVAWAVVAAKSADDERSVLAAKELRIVLRDVHYDPVDTVNVVTDSFGRASGTFLTRGGVLTGDYHIMAYDGHTECGRVSFMVSDFKMPTFEVNVDSVQRDTPGPGAVRVCGVATTYSGMPVADARVNLKLSRTSWWRWFGGGEHIEDFEAVTDAQGRFAIDIPAEDLVEDDSPWGRYRAFLAQVTVTDPNAQTAHASRTFTTGKPYALRLDMTSTRHDGSTPLRFIIKATDIDGNSKAMDVAWELGKCDSDGTITDRIAGGDALTGKDITVDLSDTPAGVYALRATPADSALADTLAEKDALILYNVSKGGVPDTGAPVFVVDERINIVDGKATVQFGVRESQWVYVAYPAAIGKLGLVSGEYAPGFHKVTVPLVKDSNIKICAVREGRLQEDAVSAQVKRPVLRLVTESYRDRLAPGGEERWTFRFVDGEGRPVNDAAMVARMYNAALDALQPSSLPSGFGFYTDNQEVSISAPGAYNSNVSASGTRRSINFSFSDDIEYLWMDMFAPIRYFKAMYMARGRAMNDIADEAEIEEEPMMSEATVAGAAPVEDSSSEQEENGSAVAADDNEFSYRPSEVLQAFFRPQLRADADGNVVIEFTVPEANGAWTFQSFGWNRDCLAASVDLRAVSAKKVMVQPNLPRFLRQGDTATLASTVYNNSGSDADIRVKAEVFDTSDNHVVAVIDTVVTVADKASAIVPVPAQAPTDRATIGYRVKAEMPGASDGEQTAIPILESAGTVIESTQFYLNPRDSRPFTFTADAADDATLTLQYCQNPVWTVVRAMRGLSEAKGDMTSVLASQIFSTLTALKINADNPSVAEVIRAWKENDSEALTSMLERNSELKALLLEQTPWLQTARNQTLRMQNLVEAMDADKATKRLNEQTEKLKSLQNSDGGFRWAAWCGNSSEWITGNVLVTMGIAQSLGMPVDSRLNDMLAKAHKYYMAEAVRDIRPDAINREAAYIAALYPALRLTAEQQALVDRTRRYIAAHTGNTGADVFDKAFDILILKDHGYESTCADLYRSIRQFAVASADTGTSFPSVDDIRGYATVIQAYTAMGAPAEDIDALRQWVLVRAQATDDLGAWNPDYVIAAVLLTGTAWTDVPVTDSVDINGTPFTPGHIEAASGYFAETLPSSGTMEITIRPNGVTPSYGSLVSVAKRTMTTVAERPGRDISVEKRFLVQRQGEWVVTEAFTAGERVKVQLIIKAGRDMEYVSVTDERAATLAPVEQLPGYVYEQSLAFYRENLDASTRLAIEWLPKGTYTLSYDMTANNAGTFASGLATVQSMLAPELTAHSGGCTVTVE